MTTKLEELRKLAEAATPGPWEVDWYVCKANKEDVEARTAKKVGDEIWRVPRSIGPIYPEENHWAKDHIGTGANDTEYLTKANPQTILAMCDLLEQMRDALAVEHSAIYGNKKTTEAIAAFDKWNNEPKG